MQLHCHVPVALLGGVGEQFRGELSYLAPLGSENISAPYFKQCFFRGGGVLPPQTVKHHASQSQDRNNKYFILPRHTLLKLVCRGIYIQNVYYL